MAKRLYVAFLVSVILVSWDNANAQALWGNTHYGMTLDEVKRAIPNLAPCAEAGNRLGDGAMGLLCKPNISVVRQLFKANFYFKEGSLTQVTLSIQGQHDYNEAKLSFDAIADVLRSKYGHELSMKSQVGVLNQATADWISGRKHISLIVLNVADAPATLNINYQVRVAGDADKL